MQSLDITSGSKMWDKLALTNEWADLDLAWKQCPSIQRKCEILNHKTTTVYQRTPKSCQFLNKSWST